MIEINHVQSYRDGGTLEVAYNKDKVFCIDNRIKSKQQLKKSDSKIEQYSVYPCYPSKGTPICSLEQLQVARLVFLKAIDYCDYPSEFSQTPAIENGLDWIERQIEKIETEIRMPLEIARIICEMESVCHSEGIGPNNRYLMKWIVNAYPTIKSEFSWLNWE